MSSKIWSVHRSTGRVYFLGDKNDKSENRVSRLGAVFYFITEKSFKPTNTISSPSLNLNIISFLCIAFMLDCLESI
jgi:hypothetical protein